MSMNVIQRTLTIFYEDCRKILESDLLQATENQLKIDEHQLQASLLLSMLNYIWIPLMKLTQL